MGNWKNKMGLRFIWSYVAVLLAALVAIFFAVNAYTGHVLKSKLLDFTQSQANESLRQLDGVVKEAQSVALQLTLDVKMTPRLALGDKVGELDIIRKLNTMKTASNHIANILLHYEGSEEVFCIDSKRTIRYFDDPTQYSFLYRQPHTSTPVFASLDATELSLAPSSSGQNAVAITYGVPYGSAQPYATVNCILPNSILQDIFAEIPQGAQYAIFLTAPDGAVFFRDADGVEAAQAALLLERAQAGGEIPQTYQVVTARSEETGLQAYLFVDETALFSSVATLGHILLLLALAVLVLAVVVNVYISRRNLAPLLDLREFLALNDLSEDDDDPLGVFGGVRQVYSDNQILTEQLALRQRNILNNVLIDVLSGGNPQALGRRFRTLSDMGVCLAAERYAVLCVATGGEGVIADKAALLLEDRIAASAYAGRMFAVCREEPDRLSVLLLLDGAEESGVSAAIAFLEAAFDACRIPVRIAAGSVEARMEDIPISASKAQALLDGSGASVRRYPSAENAGWQFWHTEGQVVRQLISSNAPDKALDYLQTIFGHVERAYPNGAARLAVAMTVAGSIAEGCIRPAQQGEYAAELDGLTQAASIEELFSKMQGLVYAISAGAYRIRQQEGAALLQTIVAYVDKNFTHEQMSLELLSQHFKVSIYFISKSFQDAAGCNFNQYLTGLRMNYAKELLRTTDQTLREITAAVGYVDESSFLRKFKAMFTVTPGQYRKQAKREREEA